jgi:hypothetical protein
VVKLRDGEFIGGRKRETTSTQEKTPNESRDPEVVKVTFPEKAHSSHFWQVS